jgi:hypothetical protein
VEGAIGRTSQIGSTPCASRCASMKPTITSTGGRAPPWQDTLTPCAGSHSPGTSGRLPLSTSAFLTQSFSFCGAQPIFAEIDMTACQRDPCCPSLSRTSRTARSRTSGDKLVRGLAQDAPSSSGVGAAGKSGAVQRQDNWAQASRPMGRCRRRSPVATNRPFAIAGGTGGTPGSPTPVAWTEKGWGTIWVTTVGKLSERTTS